ncbi:hypothetical protein DFJ77DRAFT_472218 [Powellomyces hirtus]|nr:hypothetical protein DFJ77DRAFT_472218 [Powellomyces hirtus]
MLKEKAELHEASIKRAGSWHNTIMGGRRQRLAAKEERLKKQEEEKQKIDAEWALVKQNERKQAIDRAKYLQHVEQPRIRQMHSALLQSNVLQERDMQVAQHKEELRRQREFTNATAAAQNDLAHQAVINDLQAQIRARVATVRCGREQAQQAEERRKELKRIGSGGILALKIAGSPTDAVPEPEARLDYTAQEAAIRVAKAAEWEKKQAQVELQRKALDEITAEHRIEKQQQREEETKKNEENIKFAQMKELFAAQRKHAEHHIVRQRQHRSELAGRVAAEEQENKRKVQDVFYERNVHAHDGRLEQRFAAEQHKHQLAVLDENEFKLKHAIERQERIKQEREAAIAERLQNEKEDEADIQADYGIARSKQIELDKLKAAHREQILQHKKERAERAARKIVEEKSELKATDRADAEFEAYAMGLISEWGAAGKDVKPLLRVLRQEHGDRKPPPPAASQSRTTDSYARLGMGYVTRSGAII